MRKPNPLAMTSAQLSRAQRWPIGQPVTFTAADGTTFDTTTRSSPWKLGDGPWVILLTGAPGWCAAARIAERTVEGGGR